MKRETTKYEIPPATIGTRTTVVVHDYYPSEEVKNMDRNSLEWYGLDHVYIQASLHADELPGMLVSHHLIKFLDKAAEKGAIKKHITIIPYANPLGLNQVIQGKHLGRFSLQTGVNFNRNWLDVSDKVVQRLEGQLSKDDKNLNTAVIRKALYEEASNVHSNKSEVVWKRELYKKACIGSIVLDLHCDSDAVMHFYTHDRLWPELADLTAAIGSKANLLAPESGGNPFDEAYSCPWAKIMDKFPEFPVEMACRSATLELRGELDVSDELASGDAQHIYEFLVRRGYIEDASVLPLTNLAEQIGTPLTGVDMIEATVPGVLAWRVGPGDFVENGQLLGEIVNIDDVDAPRTPIYARTSGIVYGMRGYKLSVPGDIVIKVAGRDNLEWRKGNLLTA